MENEEQIVVELDSGVFAVPDRPSMSDLIADWAGWQPKLEALASSGAAELDSERLSWLPPVMPDKLICVGTNYSDHIAEMEAAGAARSANPWPFGFLKPPHTTLVGHDVTVTLPSYAEKVDWEAELAVIIGDGSKATGPEPLDAIFGYSVLNDLSVRDFMPLPHTLGLDALVCKGFDGAAPMGPWVRPADEVADPHNIPIKLRVNGKLKQDSSTAAMVFSVREIIAHFGRILTLSPGDVIATGTPSGVGIARRPPEMISEGDVVEAELDGIGLLRTRFARGPEAPLLKA